ncbi:MULTISPECIES: alpha/beta fold hydrolase [Amycolatopsis]|uniref:Pimeloyl-ACP methyl ester carboxylesterase n=2 Tax=Amycolatopsis TaxID=1813 RepID=A0A1I4BMC3_9PSEU|nr:alpha/beta hydrolase [Amycolatopsis sacchari]SFK69337.1 Pimeloyl-ACP methyl ester carboxylesterase [Amycolatopsis sacchari]
MTTTSPNPARAGHPVGGFGSVTGTPGLPDGFADTFTSRLVDVDGVHLHIVVGGEGAPLLLLGGWPQFWYQWRLVLPALARNHTVIAVDPRGTGLSDKPRKGYDSATLARETHQLMRVLGYEQFAMVAHDVGGWTAFAMAVDDPGAITRLVLAEMIIPGISTSPPLIGTRWWNDFEWHFPFNRAYDINEKLVEGREHLYFGHQFATKAATPTAIPAAAVDVYVQALRMPGALHASFEFYREIDQILEQSEQRKKLPLDIPVLAISGTDAGLDVEAEMRPVISEITGVVLRGGHYIAEENPEAFLDVVLPFLAADSGADHG